MGGSQDTAIVERLARMEADPRVTSRIIAAIAAVQASAARAPTLAVAVSKGYENNSLTMRVRKFHNELALHVHRRCEGALYRSRGVIEAEASGNLTSSVLRCEHVVPATVVARIVWERFRTAPLEDLGRFLLTRAPVAAILRSEDADHLRKPRSYGEYGGDGKIRRWVKAHPDLLPGMDTSREGIRPMLRYHGTGIELVYAPDGSSVSMETLTFEEHERRIMSLPLYGGSFLSGINLKAAA